MQVQVCFSASAQQVAISLWLQTVHNSRVFDESDASRVHGATEVSSDVGASLEPEPWGTKTSRTRDCFASPKSYGPIDRIESIGSMQLSQIGFFAYLRRK